MYLKQWKFPLQAEDYKISDREILLWCVQRSRTSGGFWGGELCALTLSKWFRAHFWQKACNFCFVIKSSAKALHFHFQVKYCPEILWTPHPWRCSTLDWMGLWVTQPSRRFPAHSRRVARWFLRPLATQTIWSFYEIPVSLLLIWQDMKSCKHRGSRKVECFFLAHSMAGTICKGYSDCITRVGEERLVPPSLYLLRGHPATPLLW